MREDCRHIERARVANTVTAVSIDIIDASILTSSTRQHNLSVKRSTQYLHDYGRRACSMSAQDMMSPLRICSQHLPLPLFRSARPNR